MVTNKQTNADVNRNSLAEVKSTKIKPGFPEVPLWVAVCAYSIIAFGQHSLDGAITNQLNIAVQQSCVAWRFSVAVMRWSWSTQLLYIEPGW